MELTNITLQSLVSSTLLKDRIEQITKNREKSLKGLNQVPEELQIKLNREGLERVEMLARYDNWYKQELVPFRESYRVIESIMNYFDEESKREPLQMPGSPEVRFV